VVVAFYFISTTVFFAEGKPFRWREPNSDLRFC